MDTSVVIERIFERKEKDFSIAFFSRKTAFFWRKNYSEAFSHISKACQEMWRSRSFSKKYLKSVLQWKVHLAFHEDISTSAATSARDAVTSF